MAVETAEVRAAPAPTSAVPPSGSGTDRGGHIALWGVLGLGLALLAASIWGRWVLSDTEFSPAPILGPDKLPTWNLVVLRVEEVLSFAEMAVLFTFVVILPLRRAGRLGLDARIALGCLVGSVTDGVLNMHEYLFAWNAHSVDMGSWASFVPTASPDHQSRYAEALLWGVPMYTYFCIGVAIYGCKLIRGWREKHPRISDARCFAQLFGLAVVFDVVMENLVIRLGHGYAFAKTPSALTINAGSQFQWPIYECVCVGLLGVLFTGLRLSAQDSPDGLAYVERGVHRLPAPLQEPAKWFAVLGWSVLTLFVVYHLPFQFFGLTGDSIADLPSYMRPR